MVLLCRDQFWLSSKAELKPLGEIMGRIVSKSGSFSSLRAKVLVSQDCLKEKVFLDA